MSNKCKCCSSRVVKSELVVKASEQLAEQVACELAEDDPSEEKAKASLNENEISNTKTEET